MASPPPYYGVHVRVVWLLLPPTVEVHIVAVRYGSLASASGETDRKRPGAKISPSPGLVHVIMIRYGSRERLITFQFGWSPNRPRHAPTATHVRRSPALPLARAAVSKTPSSRASVRITTVGLSSQLSSKCCLLKQAQLARIFDHQILIHSTKSSLWL